MNDWCLWRTTTFAVKIISPLIHLLVSRLSEASHWLQFSVSSSTTAPPQRVSTVRQLLTACHIFSHWASQQKLLNSQFGVQIVCFVQPNTQKLKKTNYYKLQTFQAAQSSKSSRFTRISALVQMWMMQRMHQFVCLLLVVIYSPFCKVR